MAFLALASSSELSDKLVYKGARILALRLGGEQRASYDLDANIQLTFAEKYPSRDTQAQVLEGLFIQAINTHVEAQDPVRYELIRVRVAHRPRRDHRLGWNAFDVTVQLRDLKNEGILGLPNLSFDVAAPERLGANALAPLDVGGETVFAYTLERIAGEKMRAFLSSLRSYRSKVNKPGDNVRAKDLYDISKILAAVPLSDTEFWTNACEEFRLACASRYLDCMGMQTFSEDIEVTRATYDSESILPKDVDFDAAWRSIEEIVGFWDALDTFPLRFDLPTPEDEAEDLDPAT